MRRIIFCSVLCFLLGACASRYEWVKPGMTAATKEADVGGCGGKISHLTRDDPEAISIVDRCMTERGYRKKVVE